MKLKKFINKNAYPVLITTGVALLFCDASYADAPTLGTVATNISKSFGAIGKLITGGSYIAGLGFAVGAIMKFKQHKDNPTQIPIGTPASLVFIAAALLFFPTMMKTIGTSMFGSASTGNSVTSIGGT